MVFIAVPPLRSSFHRRCAGNQRYSPFGETRDHRIAARLELVGGNVGATANNVDCRLVLAAAYLTNEVSNITDSLSSNCDPDQVEITGGSSIEVDTDSSSLRHSFLDMLGERSRE